MDENPDLENLIKLQTIATFNQLTETHKQEGNFLRKEHQQLMKKLDRLEERFMEEEIDGTLYNKYLTRYTAEKKEIERNLLKLPKKKSNLEECLDLALNFTHNMHAMWSLSGYTTKQKIQHMLFPDGITYCKGECRTTRVNSVFGLIAIQKHDFEQKKSGIPELNLSYAALVAGTRNLSNFLEDLDSIYYTHKYLNMED